MKALLYLRVLAVATKAAWKGCLFAARVAVGPMRVAEGDTITFTVELKFLDPRGDTFGLQAADLRPLSLWTRIRAGFFPPASMQPEAGHV